MAYEHENVVSNFYFSHIIYIVERKYNNHTKIDFEPFVEISKYFGYIKVGLTI